MRNGEWASQRIGDATSTERLKPGADKSGKKIRPRRAEVFAHRSGANPQGIADHRLAPLPIRRFAYLVSHIHPR